MQAQGSATSLVEWEPHRLLRKIDPSEARLSRGFLRCRPEKWFPGFSAQWVPLTHSLGIEFRVTEVKPLSFASGSSDRGFCGTVDDEPLALMVDEFSWTLLLDSVAPSSSAVAGPIVLEYLARRLLGSLALSWSGSEASVFRFEPSLHPSSVKGSGAVRISFESNGRRGSLVLVLGSGLVERFDGLWRRQLRSSARQEEHDGALSIEIGQLAVPPSMLVDYLKSGTTIDLETPISDSATLRLGGRPWLPARLCSIEGNLGFEIVAGPVSAPPLPPGTTRLAIEIGSMQLSGGILPEIGQVASIWDSGRPLSNRVSMLINDERVGSAVLCAYEGRFALSVGQPGGL